MWSVKFWTIIKSVNKSKPYCIEKDFKNSKHKILKISLATSHI